MKDASSLRASSNVLRCSGIALHCLARRLESRDHAVLAGNIGQEYLITDGRHERGHFYCNASSRDRGFFDNARYDCHARAEALCNIAIVEREDWKAKGKG